MRSLSLLLSCLISCLFVAVTGCKKAVPPPSPQVAHGAELYGHMCAVCHGAKGEGYKADQATRLAQPDFLASVTDEYLREAIRNGRTGSTMSAWAATRGGPLSAKDIEDLVQFMHTWRVGPRPTLDERPVNGDLGRAENMYARECFRCHGLRGVGGPNVRIGNPQLLQSATNGFLRYAIKHGRPGTPMPAFQDKFSAIDVDDLTALLRSWATPAAPPPPPPPPTPPLALGPVPLNPKGPEPVGFKHHPANTPIDVVHAQLVRGARMALLDARAPSDYVNEHITGAVSVPFYDPSGYFAKLPKDTWLIAYCACPHAESGTLAAKLVQAGFKKVTVLDEGLGAWRMKKYGTQSGEKP